MSVVIHPERMTFVSDASREKKMDALEERPVHFHVRVLHPNPHPQPQKLGPCGPRDIRLTSVVKGFERGHPPTRVASLIPSSCATLATARSTVRISFTASFLCSEVNSRRALAW